MASGSWSVGGTQYDFGASKTWSGGNQPVGKRDRKHPNAYSMVSQRFTQSKSALYFNDGSSAGSAYLYNVAAQMRLPSTNLNLAALGKVSDSIRGHSFNAAVFAAESSESLSMIKQTSYAILRAAHFTARGRYWDAIRSFSRVTGHSKASRRAFESAIKAKDLSGAWLAIQYGWKPLMQDLFEASKAFAASASSPRELVYRGNASDKDFVDYPSRNSNGIVRAVRRCTFRYTVTLTEVVSFTRSLGLLDPASVAWEKLPFSFVADWFIPIGNFLSELSFFQGLNVSSVVSSSYSQMDVFVLKYATTSTASWPSSRPKGGHYSNTQIKYDRSVSASIDVPRPEFKDLDKAFSLGHIKNAGALIHQMASGRFNFKSPSL